jgi:hypothetical protein
VTFQVIEDAGELHSAFNQLKLRWMDLAVKFTRSVGYQGGGGKFDVYWNEREQTWALLRPHENRYWCAFGTENPEVTSGLTITCEINPPQKGINRRCAGLFFQGSDGKVYLGHTGKVGGGRRGVGKTAFLEHYRGESAELQWSDGQSGKALLVCELGDATLPARISEFVRKVQEFKRKTVPIA